MTQLRSVVLVIGLVSGSGCGLISSDVTNFDLTLPDKDFTVDASTWQVSDSEAQTFLSLSCGSSPKLCASAVQQACPMNCSGECNAATQTCDLSLDVSLYQTVDLLVERPELNSINDQPVIKVTIDSVAWEVASNTLTVATPVMTVYVAPRSVMDPGDPQAKAIGTIASVAAGTTTGPQSLVFTATGKADLVAMMSTFKTPFNVIVGSTLVLHQGQSVPRGRLDAVVHIKGHAGL